MSTVNFAEVATWFVRNGADEAYVAGLRARLAFPLVPVDDDLAVRAALLEPLTARRGARPRRPDCLALAARWAYPPSPPTDPGPGRPLRPASPST
jgi:PIN domain nuclease of toxin-antitoxin system